MEMNIRYLIIMWVVAALFLGVSIYVRGRKKPVRIWTTQRVSADEISDVSAYNRTVGKMWGIASIPLWIFGAVEYWYPVAAIIFFCIVCIIGIPAMVWYAHKIEIKYKAN